MGVHNNYLRGDTYLNASAKDNEKGYFKILVTLTFNAATKKGGSCRMSWTESCENLSGSSNLSCTSTGREDNLLTSLFTSCSGINFRTRVVPVILEVNVIIMGIETMKMTMEIK